jgi:hypothetical protein
MEQSAILTALGWSEEDLATLNKQVATAKTVSQIEGLIQSSRDNLTAQNEPLRAQLLPLQSAIIANETAAHERISLLENLRNRAARSEDVSSELDAIEVQ